MPKSEEILNGLQRIVNDYSTVAIIWHLVVYALIAALIVKWLPSNRMLGMLICIPVLSVAIIAFMSGNPFNGMLFSILAVLAFIFGLKASGQPVQTSHITFMVIGIVMIVFGLVYPHFLNTDSVIKYLYASPVGLIPCPTLSLLIGFLLLYSGFGSQPVSLTFVIFGLFYGVFGVLKLGVYLDIFLVFGSISLLIQYILALKG
ncbi:MAG: hypothetical protein R6W31_09315 [Bacteroidales bacterium]